MAGFFNYGSTPRAAAVQLQFPDDRRVRIIDAALRSEHTSDRVGLLQMVGWNSLAKRWDDHLLQIYGVEIMCGFNADMTLKLRDTTPYERWVAAHAKYLSL